MVLLVETMIWLHFEEYGYTESGSTFFIDMVKNLT